MALGDNVYAYIWFALIVAHFTERSQFKRLALLIKCSAMVLTKQEKQCRQVLSAGAISRKLNWKNIVYKKIVNTQILFWFMFQFLLEIEKTVFTL